MSIHPTIARISVWRTFLQEPNARGSWSIETSTSVLVLKPYIQLHCVSFEDVVCLLRISWNCLEEYKVSQKMVGTKHMEKITPRSPFGALEQQKIFGSPWEPTTHMAFSQDHVTWKSICWELLYVYSRDSVRWE